MARSLCRRRRAPAPGRAGPDRALAGGQALHSRHEPPRATFIGLACAFRALCLAQWQWIDKDGRKVFSDRAPPPDIPAKNILKQPVGGHGPPRRTAASRLRPAAAASGRRPKASGKDKELRGKEASSSGSRRGARRRRPRRRARHRRPCRQLQRAQAVPRRLRLRRPHRPTNAQGEREVLDDEQRAAETKRLRRSSPATASPLSSRASLPALAGEQARRAGPCLRKRSRRATFGSTLQRPQHLHAVALAQQLLRRALRPQTPTSALRGDVGTGAAGRWPRAPGARWRRAAAAPPTRDGAGPANHHCHATAAAWPRFSHRPARRA